MMDLIKHQQSEWMVQKVRASALRARLVFSLNRGRHSEESIVTFPRIDCEE